MSKATSFTNPVICAIDMKDASAAKALIQTIAPVVGGVKLGLEYFVLHGFSGVRDVVEMGVPVFLDLKFHDIPNTVAEAVRGCTRLGVQMMTIHAAGGKAMMAAAAKAAAEEAEKLSIAKPIIVAVTVLTSLDHDDLQSAGVSRTPLEQVVALAKLTKASGVDGVVCSAFEAEAVRKAVGDDFVIVSPGIRLQGDAASDQKRVATPAFARDAGASYLVIGRSITGADAPLETARLIVQDI